jgi:hypothetical protein
MKNLRFSGLNNPYTIFGYGLIVEDQAEDMRGLKVINNTKVLSDENSLSIDCSRCDLITFIDLLEIFLYLSDFKVLEFNSENFKKDEYEYDKIRMFYYLVGLDQKVYTATLASKTSNDYYHANHLLIYTVTGFYEDTYYRKLMLNQRINTVFH